MDRQNSNSNSDSGQPSKQSHQTNGSSNQNGNNEQTNGHEATDIDTNTAEYYQLFLGRLLTLVSHGQPEAVDRLIGIIRSGASQQEIFTALSELTIDGDLEDLFNGI
ncbi:hypothetical protein BDW59DRAFT_118827 [Aspergillus cavernicola]|uniref:Ribosome assembly protein 3 n=1 Tax=Aspergillus cavernicola TaxID=176166 RepID=A0ABR4HWN1_9EURO